MVGVYQARDPFLYFVNSVANVQRSNEGVEEDTEFLSKDQKPSTRSKYLDYIRVIQNGVGKRSNFVLQSVPFDPSHDSIV